MCNTGLYDMNGEELRLGQKVLFINFQEGEIVFECGAFGIAFENEILYFEIQTIMNTLEHCCGNKYSGVMNDNFISLWEIYDNFNCEDDSLYPVRIIG